MKTELAKEILNEMVKNPFMWQSCEDAIKKILETITDLEQKLKAYEDFDNAGDDAEFEPPHPIFLMAQENDQLKESNLAKDRLLMMFVRAMDGNATLEYKQSLVDKALVLTKTKGQLTLRESS